MSLPDEKQRFVADTRDYSGPLREAARQLDQFADKNSEAALAARKMGVAAKEAADKAARAQKEAADAAEKLAREEISVDEAANAAARAERELERASIKAAEAQRAVAKAADQAADNLRQAARDAELAAAAEHLGALKAAGATKDYNTSLRNLRGTYGDLKGTALESFKEIDSKGTAAYQSLTTAGEALASAGPLWVIPAATAIANLPVIASAAGGAITVALGGALSGIGLAAQAGSADVKRTFGKLKSDAGRELREISAPFHETWLHIAADARVAFHQLAPALQDAFHEIAPALSSFSTQLASALSGPKVQAATRSIGHSFAVVMDSLGPAAGHAIGDVATGIKAITDAAAANPQALSGLVTGIGQVTKYAGEGIGALIRYKNQIETFIAVGTGGGPLGLLKLAGYVKAGTREILGMHQGLQVAEQSFPSFAQQATVAAAATGHLMTAQQAATLSTNQLKNALTSLTSANQQAFDAQTAYRQALAAATAQARASNAGIKGNSAAALQNRQALSQLASAIRNVESTSHMTAGQIEGMRQKFISAAVGMGVSRKAAIDLANKLLGVKSAANSIPGSKRIYLTDNTSSVRGHIAALQRSITNLHGKTVTVNYIERVHRTLQAERARAAGGYVGHDDGFAGGGMARHFYPTGGQVNGPGTGTSDSIPAMLSNGEFVVNARATADWLPLLEAINAGVDGFAKGGMGIGRMERRQIARLNAAHARVAKARARPEYLAAIAAQRALESMRRSELGGLFGGTRITPGTGHGTVVQHTTTVTVNVQGNVWETQKLVSTLQGALMSGRMPVALPAGR